MIDDFGSRDPAIRQSILITRQIDSGLGRSRRGNSFGWPLLYTSLEASLHGIHLRPADIMIRFESYHEKGADVTYWYFTWLHLAKLIKEPNHVYFAKDLRPISNDQQEFIKLNDFVMIIVNPR